MDAQMILSPVPIADLMAQMRVIVRDELRQQQAADLQERLLSPKQTAELLGVSLVTIWSWERAGRITKHSLGGRVFFKYSEIMANLSTLQRYRKPNMVKGAAAS